jgi:hypothetical protein
LAQQPIKNKFDTILEVRDNITRKASLWCEGYLPFILLVVNVGTSMVFLIPKCEIMSLYSLNVSKLQNHP